VIIQGCQDYILDALSVKGHRADPFLNSFYTQCWLTQKEIFNTQTDLALKEKAGLEKG